MQLQKRYEVGLSKLFAAESDVAVMKEELVALQPQLVATGKEVAATLEVVDKETREAEAVQKVVQGEEAIANEKAAASKVIKVGWLCWVDEICWVHYVGIQLLYWLLRQSDTLQAIDYTIGGFACASLWQLVAQCTLQNHYEKIAKIKKPRIVS